MKLGVLGGTFDPIHLGHLIVAEEARVRLGLKALLFVPTGQPWIKEGRPVSEAHHRLGMARLAVADNPAFQVSSVEVDRPGPTYTVDTLQELRRQQPSKPDIYFILGVDTLEEFSRWREPARILELCTLVVVTRPGHGEPDRASLEALAPGAASKLQFLSGLQVGITGTEIRRRVAADLPIRYWVPRPVEEYIAKHGLYREGGAR